MALTTSRSVLFTMTLMTGVCIMALITIVSMIALLTVKSMVSLSPSWSMSVVRYRVPILALMTVVVMVSMQSLWRQRRFQNCIFCVRYQCLFPPRPECIKAFYFLSHKRYICPRNSRFQYLHIIRLFYPFSQVFPVISVFFFLPICPQSGCCRYHAFVFPQGPLYLAQVRNYNR
jgi:hypothetical protein